MRALVNRLLHVHLNVAAVLFLFWVAQFIGWISMMFYVQFLDPKLGSSVLYVTQISHWALVESAGVGATSSWVLLHAKQIRREVKGDESCS